MAYLPKTFTRHGYQVTVDAKREILVKPGDWLSKYSMAIWGDFTDEHIKAFMLKRGISYVTIENKDLIKAGDTLYVFSRLPDEPPRFWVRPPPGWNAPLPRSYYPPPEPAPDPANPIDRIKKYFGW